MALIDGVYEDVVVSAETTLPAVPAPDVAWGAVCRYFDAENHYGFQIRADGQYRIYAVVEDEVTDLVEFEASDAIDTGANASNDVLAACVGDTLSLTVNGEAVATAEDSRIASGQVGLAISSGQGVPASVAFDNFLVTGPTGITEAPGAEGTPVFATPEAVCDCSGNLYNCRDFPNRGAAQACYNSCGGRSNDVHLLDADFNGIVCETVFP
jgi:hypothetical protein